MVAKYQVDRPRHQVLEGWKRVYPKSRGMVIPVERGKGCWAPKGNFLWMVPRRCWVGRVYLLPLHRLNFERVMNRGVKMWSRLVDLMDGLRRRQVSGLRRVRWWEGLICQLVSGRYRWGKARCWHQRGRRSCFVSTRQHNLSKEE
jgi:hypothetical protein